jgi:hypothetical protein
MTEREVIRLIIDYTHTLTPDVFGLHFPDSRRIEGDSRVPDLHRQARVQRSSADGHAR